MNKKLIKKVSPVLFGLFFMISASPAFAEGSTTIDWATTLAPVQETVLGGIIAAIGIGAVLFGAVFGIRKIVAVLNGMR